MSFVIRYPGAVCVECDEEMPVGTEAAYVGEDEIAHTLCPTTRLGGKRVGETCPRCFMTKSLTGVCPNCDDE